MNSSCKYIIFLLSVLFFTSCEKVIQFNGTVTDPLVVVNSIVTPDLAVSAQVSLSRFFLSDTTSYVLVNNATVSLIVNGIQKENLTYTSKGTYLGTYKPVIGDSIQLVVQTPGKNNVSCGTPIEPQSTILSVDTSRIFTGASTPIISVTAPGNGNPGSIDTIGFAIGRTLKFVLKFTDNPAVQNYYRLVLLTKTYTTSGYTSDYSFSFDDIVSGNANKDAVGPPTSLTSNKFNVFSDDLFNGKTYPLTFSIPDNINVYYPGYSKAKPKKEIYINLQSISKSYYLYLQTRASIKTNTFFAEPVQVFSNVDGGIGILGSYTSNTIKVVL
jgi:hypothetical protein